MNWKKLTSLNQQQTQELQNKLLHKFVKHQLPYSPYYRELFKKKDLSFNEIKTTDDLQKLPFVSKADLAPTEDDRARPRQFILAPDEELIKKHAPKSLLAKIVWLKLRREDPKRMLEAEYKPIHMHFTTGRTALPTAFTYSARDITKLRETGERLLDVVGVPRDQVAINAFPYSPHLAFWLAYHAMNKLGMTSVQTGGGKIMGTQKIIDSIERLKASLVSFIPGYAYHLLREAAKQKRDFSNVKYVMFGGERVSQGLREKARQLLEQMGAKLPQIYSTYAMTEGKTAWIQCAESTGYHLYPDLEYFELVNEEGKRVQEDGELVYTSLDWRGSVVVRYRTGDLVKRINYEPCPSCGKTVPQIYPDIQRKSEVKEFNLTKVKGELINLNNFYPLLSGLKEIEEWQVRINKRNNDPHDLDEIELAVALKPDVKFDEFKTLLEKQVRDDIQVSANIVQEDVNKLLEELGMETELKEKRIVDNRPKD
ncbi:phenylacetate--CoA ligase family protein [Patescibacteria group bacterium]